MNWAESPLARQAAALIERLDALTIRERVLISVVVLAGLAAAWQLTVLEPLAREAEESRHWLVELQSRLIDANDSLEEQILQLAGSSADHARRMEVLLAQLQRVEEALGDYNRELIDPAEMARILEDMLRARSSLGLVSVRNLPPEMLLVSEEEGAPVFYRHSLEIEMEGDYPTCVDYLTAVESLPWRLYWQALDVEALDYPINRIRLELSTLSLDEDWIGA
ncbi:MAG: hypothetical protein R3315_05280 [Woeseiaceae bacterium]|nr:hypothetical protein [Woeseiaceae bacterium]